MSAIERVAKSYKLPKDVAEMLAKLATSRRLPETYVVVGLIVDAYERKWPTKPERVSIVDERRTAARKSKLWTGDTRVVVYDGGYYEVAAQQVNGRIVLDWMIEDAGNGVSAHSFTLGDLEDFLTANPVPPPRARFRHPPPGFDGVDYD